MRALNYAANGGLIALVVCTLAFNALTVDSDISQGWTALEILRNAPQDNWAAYESSLETNPVLTKACISGLVYMLGDLSAQTYEGKGLDDLDRARTLRSGVAGFVGHGPLSHLWYLFCDDVFSGFDIPSIGIMSSEINETLLKVLVDQTLWSAFWNSIYYLLLGVMKLEDPRITIATIRDTWFTLLKTGWKLWPFAHLLTYGVIPLEHRLLWVDFVEIVWVTILSFIGNTARSEKEKEAFAAVHKKEQAQELLTEAASLGVVGSGVLADVASKTVAPNVAVCPIGEGDFVEELVRGIQDESSVTFINEDGGKVTKNIKDVFSHPEPPSAEEFAKQ